MSLLILVFEVGGVGIAANATLPSAETTTFNPNSKTKVFMTHGETKSAQTQELRLDSVYKIQEYQGSISFTDGFTKLAQPSTHD